MHDSDGPIVATLAFAGALRWPLTLMEIHERVRMPVAEVMRRLDKLVAASTVSAGLGMYALAPVDEQTFQNRVNREKECVQKWRRALRYASVLQAVPYVRALLASGSLALGNTGPDSDWDAFVIAREGRLYTARAFLLIAAKLMGRLRVKQDTVAPDKFCFNHYITTDGLDIAHRSLYVAHALSVLVPIHDPDDLLGRLRQANRWTTERIPHTAGSVFVRRAVVPSHMLDFVRRALERVLDTRAGDWLETRLARWQKDRIAREPATHEPGGRVLATDRQLEFHPRSAEATVLDAYNRTLAHHGLSELAEQDSGLTR